MLAFWCRRTSDTHIPPLSCSYSYCSTVQRTYAQISYVGGGTPLRTRSYAHVPLNYCLHAPAPQRLLRPGSQGNVAITASSRRRMPAPVWLVKGPLRALLRLPERAALRV